MFLRQATSLLDGSEDFEIGFFKGKEKVWIENDRQVENLFSNDSELILWAEPAKPTKVRKVATKRGSQKRLPFAAENQAFSGDSDSSVDEDDKVNAKKKARNSKQTKRKRKDEEVLNLADEIKEKLDGSGKSFTAPQIRLWAEMIHCGTHASVTTPPKIPALGFSKERRQTITEKITDSMATMANSISAVVSPQSTEQKNAGGYYRGIPFENTTPRRKSRLRSEGLKQLMELKELKDSNILTESQFEEQKEKILKDLS